MELPVILIDVIIADCGYSCSSCAKFVSPGAEGLGSSAVFVLRRAPNLPGRSAPLSGLRPQCAGYQTVGVIYLGMASAGGGRSNKRDRLPTQHADVSPTNFLRNEVGYENFRP